MLVTDNHVDVRFEWSRLNSTEEDYGMLYAITTDNKRGWAYDLDLAAREDGDDWDELPPDQSTGFVHLYPCYTELALVTIPGKTGKVIQMALRRWQEQRLTLIER